MGKRHKQSGLRKALRGFYKILGAVNTASYVIAAPNRPGALGKHLARKSSLKRIGGILK